MMKRWQVLLGIVASALLVAFSIGSARAVTADRQTPDKSFGERTIRVEIDSRVVGVFSEISGLQSQVAIVQAVEADGQAKLRPGRPVFGNITLKREFNPSDTYLTTWFNKVMQGQVDRKSGSIIYLDRDGKELARYNFFEAWPCRWKAPELNSSSDTHLIEEIEFVVEKVERG